MARRPAVLSPNSVSETQPEKPAPFVPRDINAEPADTTITIDAATGLVTTENPDGSLTVGEAGKPKRDRTKESFDDNLADDMGEMDLASIAMHLLEGIEADIASRRDWEETAAKGADFLGVKLEEAASEVSAQGTVSKIHHTGLLKAVSKSWANSRAELLPVGGPVKVRDDEPTGDEPPDDPLNVVQMPGTQTGPKPLRRNELADALEMDMNHYLTVTDREYYPDFSRMLFSRALLGCQFRKVYKDPILRRPVSRWVKGTDLIVSNEATHLSGAARVTERIPMRQGLVKRLQKRGHWLDIPLVTPTSAPSPMETKIGEVQGVNPMIQLPADQLHTIFECYCELDNGRLAEDETGTEPGFPLPYRVTMDKDSRVILEIRRNWKQGDEEYTPRRRYVKYPFVPGLGFYDLGYIHLIGNPQRGATAIERIMIDTGMLNAFPGGVMGKSPGTRQRSTEIRPAIGEFTVMDTGGMPINQFIMPWPYKEPSAVLAALGQDLAKQMDDIAGTMELPVGEGRVGDVPVGTIMALIESISKVPSAIHKDDHIAQQEEFELLKELFVEEPEALWKFARTPARKWQQSEEISDQELVPAADPNVPSQIHRIMQATALVQLATMPQFQGIANLRAIWDIATRTMGVEDNSTITMPEQPPAPPQPDPKMAAVMAKVQSDKADNDAKLLEIQQTGQAKITEAQIEAQDHQAERDSEEARAAIQAKTDETKAQVALITHAAGQAVGHVQHTQQLAQDAAQNQNNTVTGEGTGIVPPDNV